MARRPSYDPDPATVQQQLSVEEIESMRTAGGNPLRDQRAYDHFLARVYATVRAYQAEFNRLHRQVSEMHIRAGTSGAPTSLDPRDAVRYLPRGELATLVEGHLRAQVQMLDGLARDTEAQLRRATALVNQVKYLLLSLLEATDLDPVSRAALERIHQALPSDEALAPGAAERSARLVAQFAQAARDPSTGVRLQVGPGPERPPDSTGPAAAAPGGGAPSSGGDLDDLFDDASPLPTPGPRQAAP